MKIPNSVRLYKVRKDLNSRERSLKTHIAGFLPQLGKPGFEQQGENLTLLLSASVSVNWKSLSSKQGMTWGFDIQMHSSHNYCNTPVPRTARICILQSSCFELESLQLYSNSLIKLLKKPRDSFTVRKAKFLRRRSYFVYFCNTSLGEKTYWNSEIASWQVWFLLYFTLRKELL